ncbi:MAG: hypothetical protein GY723_01320 [bacterium]|nr:hypothetical protein [bacterium]MCP5069967.1 hypothetical protein [bacterium]
MKTRSQLIHGIAAVFLGVCILLPAIADARGSSRRNYADEMRRDRIRKERDDESRERQERYYKERSERQERYIEHRERQLDSYISHRDRVHGTSPSGGSGGAPAPSGGPCMYGGNNEVIHRPAGAVCRGDKPAQAPAAQQPAAAQTTRTPAKETKGTCVYGKSGKLLYSSAGAEC